MNSVAVDDVIIALAQLGGEADSSAIKTQVIANRGNILPEQYSYWASYRNTIDQVIHHHCPQCAKFLGGNIYFEQVSKGRYKLVNISVTDETITPTSKDNDKLSYATLGIAEEADELIFPEGKEFYKLHRSRERNSKLVELAKQRRIANDPLLRCEVCSFSFIEAYGEVGQGFIEAHHIIPISQLSSEIGTKVEDIALVCSNCHRMLHRYRPWLSINELKSILQTME